MNLNDTKNNLTPEILKIKNTIKWYGYFSSTSVYGNHLGKWVDETSKTQPRNLRGKLRQKSEAQHLKLSPEKLVLIMLPKSYPLFKRFSTGFSTIC